MAALFKFVANGVVLKFEHPVDINSMRLHPEYVEVDEKGKEIGKRSDGMRPEWDIPMKPAVGAPKKSK